MWSMYDMVKVRNGPDTKWFFARVQNEGYEKIRVRNDNTFKRGWGMSVNDTSTK